MGRRDDRPLPARLGEAVPSDVLWRLVEPISRDDAVVR